MGTTTNEGRKVRLALTKIRNNIVEYRYYTILL
jgi:hypothetical protein